MRFGFQCLCLLLCAACSCQSKIIQVTPPILHGEGPHWDNQRQSLYYVNTFNSTVLKWTSITNKITSHQFDGNTIGFVIPIKSKQNSFIVCRDRYINLFQWDGLDNNTGTEKHLTYVDPNKENNQFNDGKVDASGRLWGGTLTRNEDLSVAPNGGTLYLIDGGCAINVESKKSSVSISNGLAWSNNNKKFFYIDSETRKIDSYDFNLQTGNIDNRTTLFDLNKYPNLKGIPDGMTIDANDNLWVALYGGKSVLKVNSTSGQLLQRIEMPATYVTSATFGGSNLNILYVTTSRLKLTKDQLLQEPMAGSVFAIYGLGVTGCLANNYEL